MIVLKDSYTILAGDTMVLLIFKGDERREIDIEY